jgi:hypothetical protein
LDDQEYSLQNVVELKIYSFMHYLRCIEFKGYAKWCILNQSVKEEHPQGTDLFTIIENMEPEKADEHKFIDVYHRNGANLTPGEPVMGDEIYNGLI